MGILELYPLDQVSSNCVLKVHQIEGIPPDPLEDVTSTPQLKHVHKILNTFEAILTSFTYVNTFLFL